jgi:hypothetical protein
MGDSNFERPNDGSLWPIAELPHLTESCFIGCSLLGVWEGWLSPVLRAQLFHHCLGVIAAHFRLQ